MGHATNREANVRCGRCAVRRARSAGRLLQHAALALGLLLDGDVLGLLRLGRRRAAHLHGARARLGRRAVLSAVHRLRGARHHRTRYFRLGRRGRICAEVVSVLLLLLLARRELRLRSGRGRDGLTALDQRDDLVRLAAQVTVRPERVVPSALGADLSVVGGVVRHVGMCREQGRVQLVRGGRRRGQALRARALVERYTDLGALRTDKYYNTSTTTIITGHLLSIAITYTDT